MSGFTFGAIGERNKERKLGRTGGRGGSNIRGIGGAFQRHVTRREMTPTQLAALNLTKALEAYPIVTKDQRQLLKRQMIEMAELRVMNMKYLAATLVILNSLPPAPEPPVGVVESEGAREFRLKGTVEDPTAYFLSNPKAPTVWDIVRQELSGSTAAEVLESTIRMKEQLLTYIVKVNGFRREQSNNRKLGIDQTEYNAETIEETPEETE